jgi:hypothetical protein
MRVLQHHSYAFGALANAALHPAELRQRAPLIVLRKTRLQAFVKMASSKKEVILFLAALRVTLGKLVLVCWTHHWPPRDYSL